MSATPKRELSLFDSTSIIVGIIIGAGIYQMAPAIAQGAGSSWGVMAIWVIGGLLSLCGALSYAELATAYPVSGGDYVYLSKAYGRWAGFLFGWAQLTVVRPGDIVVMAFAFATYARAIYDPLAGHPGAQSASLRRSSRAGADDHQHPRRHAGQMDAESPDGRQGPGSAGDCRGGALIARRDQAGDRKSAGLPLSLAFIFVLFVYGGWNEMAYVAAEVKNPRRNIVRALVTGTAAVIALYLLVNGAFLYTLGYDRLATSDAVASEASWRPSFPSLGVPAGQRPDLHLRPGGRQWADLHRGPHLLRPGREPPVFRKPGLLEPPHRHAGPGPRLAGTHRPGPDFDLRRATSTPSSTPRPPSTPSIWAHRSP